MTQKTPSIFKKSSDLAILTVISRILGLVRESTTAAFLGTGVLADAFSVAFIVPDMVRRLFADGVISAAFIPQFKGLMTENKREWAAGFLNAVFSIVTVFAFVTVVILMIFSGNLVSLLAPSFDAESAKEAAFLAKIMFPYIFFITLAALIQSVLNSSGIFRPSGCSPIVFNVVFITLAFLLAPLSSDPARALSIGVLAGGVMQMAIQFPFMAKTLFKFRFVSLKKAFGDPMIKKSSKMILATLFGTGAYQINILLTTNFASKAGVGVVSSLRFSARIEELILGIFVVTLSTVILPELVENAKSGNSAALEKNLSSALNFVAIVSIPAVIFTLFNSDEMVKLLFGFGRFDGTSVTLTSDALRFRIAGLFFIAVSRIMISLFYAFEKTTVPIIAGLTSIVVNFVTAYFLVGSLAGGGIALASTIAAFSCAAILFGSYFFSLKGSLKLGKVFVCFVKVSIISTASLLPLFFLKGRIYAFFETVSLPQKICELCSFSLVALVFGVLFFTFSLLFRVRVFK